MPSYLTNTEFLNFPTDVDTAALVPGGNAAQQTQALTNAIAAASGWLEAKCGQILSATVDTELKRIRPSRDGFLYVWPNFFPIVSVTSLSYDGARSGAPSWISVTGSYIELYSSGPTGPRRFGVRQDFSALCGFGDPDLRVQYTYVNGYVNTAVSAVAAGATSLTVQNSAGIVAGNTYTIADGGLSESVTVANSYVSGSTTVPLAAGLVSAHVAGAALHGMPMAIKEAAALVSAYYLKNPRGTKAMMMQTTGPKPGGGTAGADRVLLERALELINPWVKKW